MKAKSSNLQAKLSNLQAKLSNLQAKLKDMEGIKFKNKVIIGIWFWRLYKQDKANFFSHIFFSSLHVNSGSNWSPSHFIFPTPLESFQSLIIKDSTDRFPFRQLRWNREFAVFALIPLFPGKGDFLLYGFCMLGAVLGDLNYVWID